MKNFLKNQKGVALLIVISVIGILSSVMVDFLFQTGTQHEMVLQEKARLQAYYLAKSSLNFSKMLLLYNKKIEAQINKMGGADAASKMGMQPIYKMFPMSSELLRGLISGSSDTSEDGNDAASPSEEGSGSEEDAPIGEIEGLKKSGMMKSKEAEDFLKFDGNFESEISEEQSKYSINAISKIAANSPSYDMQKKVLLSILMQKTFKNFFQTQELDAPTLVHAIADFVDSNDVINEFDNVERGPESSLYKEVDYPPKNARLLTLSELRLVPGMTDDIYLALEPSVSVYQSSDKINVCLADEALVDSLIVHYTTYAECTPPVSATDTEKLKELREAMLLACPDAAGVASALNVALGLKEDDASTDEISGAGLEDSQDTTKQKASSTVEGCKIQFESLISSTNSIFRIKANGVVGDVHMTITTVLDTTATDTSSWKVLYYQAQ